MGKKVRAIPKGYHTATPYLIVDDAAAAIKFYKKAFGAKEVLRFPGPGGKLMHAEILIGDSPIMLADEAPERGAKSPKSYGGSPVGILLYVEKVDKVARKAVEAGATEVMPIKDQFYGDRSGTFADPFGHKWTISTHVENVSEKEMIKRFEEMSKPQAGG